jgi:tRNA pseudouridine38-40 synthase
MARFKLSLEYEGTRYAGWQIQKNARTVQGEFFTACEKVFGTKTFELYASGRTDSGVHALEQIAHLEVQTQIPPLNIQYKLNDHLPADINILQVEKAAPNFHARHDATARSYVYLISRRRTAFGKPFVWWIKDPLKTDAMQDAARLLEGFRDFRSFTDDSPDEKSTDVEMRFIDLYEMGELIIVHIVGSHFLWKMVRRIVGSLAEVGRGHLQPHQILDMMEGESPVAKFTAPPSGLFLEKVYYPGEEVLRGEESFKLPIIL